MVFGLVLIVLFCIRSGVSFRGCWILVMLRCIVYGLCLLVWWLVWVVMVLLSVCCLVCGCFASVSCVLYWFVALAKCDFVCLRIVYLSVSLFSV